MDVAVNNLGVDSTLDLHIYALAASGLVLLFMGIAGFGASTGSRVTSLIVGIAALGYAVYLAFIFTGEKYWISFYAYVLPVVLIVNAIRSARAARAHRDQTPPA
jgi:hypothetical protein